jgi:phasin family protein
MAKDAKPLEDVNANAKQFANQIVGQTMEQTRAALDNYFSFVQKAMSSFPLSGTEFGEKLKSYAETNIAATNEYVRKLSEAKDLQEVVRIQTEFVQQQFNAFGEQTKSLAEIFTKASTEAVKERFRQS